MTKLTFDPNPPTAQFNGWAVAGLVVGVVAIVTLLIQIPLLSGGSGLVAFLCGMDGISKARKGAGGIGIAIAAVCLGAIPLAIVAYYLILAASRN